MEGGSTFNTLKKVHGLLWLERYLLWIEWLEYMDTTNMEGQGLFIRNPNVSKAKKLNPWIILRRK